MLRNALLIILIGFGLTPGFSQTHQTETMETKSMVDVLKLQQEIREQYLFGFFESKEITEVYDSALMARLTSLFKLAVETDAAEWEQETAQASEEFEEDNLKAGGTLSRPALFVRIKHKRRVGFPGFKKDLDPTLITMYEAAFNLHYPPSYISIRGSKGASEARSYTVDLVVAKLVAAYMISEKAYWEKIRKSAAGKG